MKDLFHLIVSNHASKEDFDNDKEINDMCLKVFSKGSREQIEEFKEMVVTAKNTLDIS